MLYCRSLEIKAHEHLPISIAYKVCTWCNN